MNQLLAVLLHQRVALVHRWREERTERGDVPGWVLVTVMTAGLVMAIWGVADDQLSQMLKNALDQVKN
jgi:hypothetical protein